MGLLYSNYQANPTTNLNVNAVSGALTKTFRNSYFVRYHMYSKLAEVYLDGKNPHYVVVQTMLCGDKEFLSEVIDKKDYDEMFEAEEKKK